MITALLEGFHRIARAPLFAAGIYLVTALTVVPLGLAVTDDIDPRLGNQLVIISSTSSDGQLWLGEFLAQAHGFARTLAPPITGFATLSINLGTLLDMQQLDSSVITTIVAYLVVWTFLVGGLLDHLARQRQLRSVGFLAACCAYFTRLCRLTVLATLAYAALFTVVNIWLFNNLFALAMSDSTVTSTASALEIVLYIALSSLLAAVHLVVDYAKIRTVVEDRYSMVGAILASIRFIRHRPADVMGLFLLNILIYLLVLSAYAGVTTGIAVYWSQWQGVLIAQIFVVARVLTTLVMYGSQMAYFQNQLADATYIAAPQPYWLEDATKG